MGIAHFEKRACLGAGLLNGSLDNFVYELRNQKPEREEHALKFAAEDEVRKETAEADEDWD